MYHVDGWWPGNKPGSLLFFWGTSILLSHWLSDLHVPTASGLNLKHIYLSNIFYIYLKYIFMYFMDMIKEHKKQMNESKTFPYLWKKFFYRIVSSATVILTFSIATTYIVDRRQDLWSYISLLCRAEKHKKNWAWVLKIALIKYTL